jgi:hypothetical protein
MIPAAHVIFILDDSGSMGTSAAVTKKSFDGMVEALQLCKGADIVMSLIKYGSRPVLNYARTHIQEVKSVKYNPSSGDDTIYDSMLFAIDLASKSPREEKTIIILQADGGDTCSKARPPQVMAAVMAAKKRGMEFLFLGAEHHAGYVGILSACARSLGFSSDELIMYQPGMSKESLSAFSETASNIGSVASRLTEHASFTKEQRERVKKT